MCWAVYIAPISSGANERAALVWAFRTLPKGGSLYSAEELADADYDSVVGYAPQSE
jgi:hypothetical protein